MKTLKTALPMLLMGCLLILLPSLLMAGPGARRKEINTSVGFRAGWAGAPNGFTMRKQIDAVNAFEFVGGINNKAMRRSEFHNGLWQFDTYLGASYQPSFMAGTPDFKVGFYGDFGVRARIHNYRFHYGEPNKITPDLIGGGGMLIQSNSIEIFADIHAKYSESGGAYAPGVESGLGLRINL